MSSIGYNIKEIIVENIKQKQNQIKSHPKSKLVIVLRKAMIYPELRAITI